MSQIFQVGPEYSHYCPFVWKTGNNLMQKGSKMTEEAHGLLLSLKMEEGTKEGSSHENINLPPFQEQEQPSLPLQNSQ